jgi:hypothetical protein
MTALTSYGFPGDANLDGQVDVADLGILASHWQITGFWTDGDLDNNGLIDVGDLGILATHGQHGVESLEEAINAFALGSASTPEPVAGVLAVCCCSRVVSLPDGTVHGY